MLANLQISLSLYEEQYTDKLLQFHLPPEQAEFTGLPAETLHDAITSEDKSAVVILEGGNPVGFFILHTGEAIADFYSDYSGAVLLRAFLIDYGSQGKGIAKAAMARLPDFVRTHYPESREMVLAVNERNIAAIHLYTRAGFRDYGLRRAGGKGPQKILQYDLRL